MNKLIQGASVSLEICIDKNWTPNIVFSLGMVSISYLIFDINNKYQGNDMHGNEIEVPQVKLQQDFHNYSLVECTFWPY